MPERRARSSSARCSINSMSATSSSRRLAWSSRSSTTSGLRSRRISSSRADIRRRGNTEEKAREEYLGIAERRVRLGLVIAEIGEQNNIKVSDEQLRTALMEQVRQFPGRAQIWRLQKNPSALAAMRAPLFEDKVVDFLVELADVTDQAGFAGRIVQGRRSIGLGAGIGRPARLVAGNFHTYLPYLHSRLGVRSSAASTNRPNSSHTMPGSLSLKP